jgi:hypothetical protein
MFGQATSPYKRVVQRRGPGDGFRFALPILQSRVHAAPNLGMTTGSSPVVTQARHQTEHPLPQLQKSAADAL